MKHLWLILCGTSALLLLACAQPAIDAPATVRPSEEGAATATPALQIEEITEPYQDPLSYEAVADADEVFARTRIRLTLPDGAANVELALITNQRGTDCVQAVFDLDGMPCWYRVGYTAAEENLADDETTYANRTLQEYFGVSYFLLTDVTRGRVQWYDTRSGTSNSLYVPYSVDARVMEDAAIVIMAGQMK